MTKPAQKALVSREQRHLLTVSRTSSLLLARVAGDAGISVSNSQPVSVTPEALGLKSPPPHGDQSNWWMRPSKGSGLETLPPPALAGGLCSKRTPSSQCQQVEGEKGSMCALLRWPLHGLRSGLPRSWWGPGGDRAPQRATGPTTRWHGDSLQQGYLSSCLKTGRPRGGTSQETERHI